MLSRNYFAVALSLLAFSVTAEDNDVQDMSDPTAVYSQVGFGVTNKGLNFKYGGSYKTGVENRLGMNVLEIKGFGGEALGWDSNSVRDNSIDSVRLRNFELNTTNGRGAQIDVLYYVDSETGSASYSFIQATPKFGPVQFFPLAGAGLAFGNDVVEDDGTIDSGYSVMGTFTVIGMYSKFTVTDKIWLNYNPFYTQTLSGSDNFKDYGMEGDDSVLTHEFSASYQINPRANIRYYANWSENIDISDGDHRIEFNYQLP